jgi:endonuclease YncB( thermonuclease family)
MREKRLRWGERSAEVRLDDHPTPAPPLRSLSARWRGWAFVAVAAVVAAAGWSRWQGQAPRLPAAIPSQAGEPPVAGEAEAGERDGGQGWLPESPVLQGRVLKVTDGDSIHVQLSSGPIKVRLHSIDAPERDQPGGREARAVLERRLHGVDVALEPIEQDQYGRMIAVVYLGDTNVNAWLVREGQAWVYREYARDPRYCAAETQARGERRGIWALPAAEQLAPWEWRAVQRGRREGFSDFAGETLDRCKAALGHRPTARVPLMSDSGASSAASTPSQSQAAPGECRIKGNVGSSGRIYHVPGSHAYAKTRIDESKGERWFCTEDEARAAGWRPPRG